MWQARLCDPGMIRAASLPMPRVGEVHIAKREDVPCKCGQAAGVSCRKSHSDAANSCLAHVVPFVAVGLGLGLRHQGESGKRCSGFLSLCSAKAEAAADTSGTARPYKEAAEVTPRIRLWRALVSTDVHTMNSLAMAAGVSVKEASGHLEHVMRQAKTLKNKSIEWREKRGIPAECDTSAVRIKLLPATCGSCGWSSKSDRLGQKVKVCKSCGSRDVSPVLIHLEICARGKPTSPRRNSEP
mmetsp:Transcript_28673/g.66466  ORF Transcript_28673/g.66466 Transcript_28673/m.66466 type:complete len:241 (+) Transcript_28673:2-724(+)